MLAGIRPESGKPGRTCLLPGDKILGMGVQGTNRKDKSVTVGRDIQLCVRYDSVWGMDTLELAHDANGRLYNFYLAKSRYTLN
jgi:hypothetical protein